MEFYRDRTRVALRLHILLTTSHSIVNTFWYSTKKSTNLHFQWPWVNKRRFNFQSNLCWCFIIHLLMQHIFHCVNLICRSWRTWKSNQITHTYLRWCLHGPTWNVSLMWWMSLIGHMYWSGVWTMLYLRTYQIDTLSTEIGLCVENIKVMLGLFVNIVGRA